jgi:peptide/nickel transport system permease protein
MAKEGTALGRASLLRQPVERSMLSKFYRMSRRSLMFSIGGAIVLLVTTVAILAPLVAPHDPVSQNLANVLVPPVWSEGGTWDHPLGTDHYGRDVMSRILYGTRISLIIATFAALIGASVGVTAGIVAGYYTGITSTIIMRIVDINLAFPLILLALTVVAILGPSMRNMIIVMAITTWMIYARVVRGVTLSISQQEFVEAARAVGAHDFRILARHILPNLLAPILVIWTLEVARVILMESALSFLGLGVPPPTPSWGRMLAEGRDYLTVASWIATYPGIAIMITVLGINFLGDGLRDLLDPRQSKT